MLARHGVVHAHFMHFYYQLWGANWIQVLSTPRYCASTTDKRFGRVDFRDNRVFPVTEAACHSVSQVDFQFHGKLGRDGVAWGVAFENAIGYTEQQAKHQGPERTEGKE